MTPFDPIHIPLQGIHLIEAAAGTGKTYAIENLYLRLVLEKELPVEQILVVTFTRAATAELRDRIYRRLARARPAFAGTALSGDEFLSQWLDRHPWTAAAERRLRQALMDFDRAAIFTIHGFCQRLLYENAFETGSTFDTELLRDPAPILLEVVEDFWRRSICQQPAEFLRFVQTEWQHPSDLLGLVRAAAAEFAVIPRIEAPGLREQTLQTVRRSFQDLQVQWSRGREDVRHLLLQAPLDGKRFGRAPSETGGRSPRREQVVQGLVEALDGYTATGQSGFPSIRAVEQLALSNLARHTLRRQPPPTHPVFEACEALHRSAQSLSAEMTQHLLFLKTQLLASSKREVERRKREKGVLAFDDLLRHVARALDGRRGHALADKVRQRYRAVLVDEFQDTDDLQYTVFSRLFATPAHLLILIGDPKQAIYGFRGADIFSYLRAARAAETCFTLDRNWRATDGLVRAVNTLFGRAHAPFLFEDIRFHAARAVRGDDESGPPMTIWHVDSRRYRADGKPLTSAEAQALIARAVTVEIRRLIEPRDAAITAGDIAVLVPTNRQANLMKDHLCAAGVACVVYSTADVFESPEAPELLRVLASIAEPQSLPRLKSAMATRLLGATAAEIAGAERDDSALQRRVQGQWDYFRWWSEQGFTAMFRRFLRRERLPQRLIARPDGERRLTNLLHLAELIHRAAEDENLGVTGMMKWLGRQLDPRTPRSEENQLRLESDALAVKIVTVHRSKGLEYPVVFCPFAWSGSALRDAGVFFHDPAAGFRWTADLSGDRNSSNRRFAQNERLAESLRLLYVSLTRARQRCYLAWGRIHTAETSALAYLLRARGSARDASLTEDWLERLTIEYRSTGDDELRHRLDELAAAADGAIAIRSLPETASLPAPAGARSVSALAGREFRGRIDPGWTLTSYSALVSAAEADAPDRDAGPRSPTRREMDADSGSSAARSLFEFPAGARSGTFFHSILEALDFTATDPRPLVRAKLKEFGFEPSWEDTICAMIADVLAVPLFAGESSLRLAEIRKERKVAEMEFCFPLQRLTPALLEAVLSRMGGGGPRLEQPFPVSIGRLRFTPVEGYMKGFIDLVFEHRDRFYLVDWKSNRLGPAPEDYHCHRLSAVMAEHGYHLQYHLYTLAFHQYLRRRVPGYDYARHFGGICYVFLRGVNRGRGPEFGLFHDRPAPELVNELAERLIANDVRSE